MADTTLNINIDEVSLATNDLGRTAWGIPKVALDNSIFHGMFTYNVPVTTWQETINSVISSSFTNASSIDGKLNLTSGATNGDLTYLRTFRNPRYEPNRGFHYAISAFLPSVSALGNRRWGYFTDESGAFFSLESGTLYAVVRTTTTASGTVDDKHEITIPIGVDLSKGNLFDIQMQWRGVGNYKFFINLELVKTITYLNTRTELTMFNPANPIAFECENQGDDVVIQCGCVDVTSENGETNGKTYGSAGITNSVGESAYTGANQPIVAVRSKLTVGGLINTRDTLSLLASFFSDEKSICRIWVTRDFSAITEGNSSWSDIGDGHLETIEMTQTAGTLSFDTAKADLIFTCRVGKERTYATSALFEGRTSIYQTPGDMFIFTMHRENLGATKGGVTYEFAEEI